jgi:GNAT superfamily N-acetyltransferase
MADIADAVREAEAVRKADANELPVLASVLARAFFDDPVFVWMLPDASRRLETQERFFALVLRELFLSQEESYTTDGFAGVAVWELPAHPRPGAIEQLKLLPSMLRVFGRRIPRAMQAMTALESNHPERAHFYLPFLGVAPEWQGRGIGSALMRPVLSRCDREGIPAYLEASTPRNRALYERHGFAVTEEFRLAKGSPPLWRMWREPAT